VQRFHLSLTRVVSHAVPFAALVLLLGCLAACRSAEPTPGALVVVGGGALPDAIADRFLELAGGKGARIVVIPTASAKADTPQLLRSPAYWKARGASVVVLHATARNLANDPAFVRPLTEATGVWLSGGKQSRLAAVYRGTLVEHELRQLLARGGVVGGTSAGAAILSEVMIRGGNPHATVGTGFGLLPGVVIDTHFQNRHRLGRLQGVVAGHPAYAGLGIDEQTGVVVAGGVASVLGNGNVRLCRAAPEVQVLKAGDRVDLAGLRPAADGPAEAAP
jgi:cyanophycinase